MEKDYKIWMPVKSEINNKELCPLGIKEREIWVCNLGENVGFEEDGKGEDFTRPVLILKAFNKRFCYVLPLSTTNKRGKYYYPFNGKTGKLSVALLTQIKSIDSVRLRDKIGMASKREFREIKKRAINLIF